MTDSLTTPRPTELDSEEIQKKLSGIQIPPRPQLLTEIDHEFRKENPSLNTVAGLIARDVSLSAAALKTVNSPFFGLSRKITAVPLAIQMIGLKNIKCLVTGLLLKQTTGKAGNSFERFWDASERVAIISAHIAGMLPKVPRDFAYSFGLFREIGIPLMMQRFPDYKNTLQEAASSPGPMTELENERYSINHAVIGRMVARTWLLPDELCEGILLHHDPRIIDSGDGISPLARTLVMINYLAENLHEREIRMRDNPQWELIGEAVLEYLGFSHTEMEDLKLHIHDL